MREIKAVHNNATQRPQAALIEIGDPELEVPVPQTAAIKKANLLSRESFLNIRIRASIASLQELVNGEQMMRGHYDEASTLVTDLTIRLEREYAGIAGQLETITLGSNNTDEDQDAVRATMELQANQGSIIRILYAVLVRKMPAPEPVHQPLIPAGLRAGQDQDAEGRAGQERQKLKLQPTPNPSASASSRPAASQYCCVAPAQSYFA